ncbi:conserved hypothetical protein [Ricinus communis]|uniref:Uncharacterized protein n=1 Tax=Ricinus communis TaxID=3988 RepID=B9SUD4_RICCO|nr:conserved hypothetical protein [Ricinus communis]
MFEGDAEGVIEAIRGQSLLQASAAAVIEDIAGDDNWWVTDLYKLLGFKTNFISFPLTNSPSVC